MSQSAEQWLITSYVRVHLSEIIKQSMLTFLKETLYLQNINLKETKTNSLFKKNFYETRRLTIFKTIGSMQSSKLS